MLGFFDRNKPNGLFLSKHAHPLVSVGGSVSGRVRAIPGGEPVSTALRLCLSGHRNIPVTDGSGDKCLGIVTSRAVLDLLGGGELYDRHFARGMDMELPASSIAKSWGNGVDRNQTLKQALDAMKSAGAEVMPLYSGIRFDGLLRESDFVFQIRRPTGVKVREVMTPKPSAASSSSAISDAAAMLVRGAYTRLPVVRDGFLAGIVTPHDVLRYLHSAGKTGGLRNDRTELSMAMNKAVVSVGPEADVAEAVGLMREKSLGMLPVAMDYRLIGVITQRDILEAM
jgi:CBS domain-containing protein